MSFPDKEKRTVCWTARDNYWNCLDKYENASNHGKVPKECQQVRKLYEQGCPAQWVKHFDRKREYLQFKEKVEKGGYEPIETKEPS